MDPGLDFLGRLLGEVGRLVTDGKEVRWQVLRRAGQPFLLLPRQSREAVATLGLYAPQTLRARLACGLLRWSLKFSVPLPGERIWFEVSPKAPFVKFLASLSSNANFPGFGILAGNPSTPGQRFILLCFNIEHQPIAVVKAALSQRGHELIQHEESFLSAVASEFKGKGIPVLQATFKREDVRAFATPFVEGNSPRESDEVEMPSLLNSWAHSEKTILLAEVPAWLRLQEACNAEHLFQAIAPKLKSQRVHPCVYHGDFVPWNIKISLGRWTALDWERGEPIGIPGWDWFHYVIQTGILVQRQMTIALVERVERLLASDSFKDYAFRSGIDGFKRELLLSYLLHLIEVIQPSEGRVQNKDLLTDLAARWQIG